MDKKNKLFAFIFSYISAFLIILAVLGWNYKRELSNEVRSEFEFRVYLNDGHSESDQLYLDKLFKKYSQLKVKSYENPSEIADLFSDDINLMEQLKAVQTACVFPASYFLDARKVGQNNLFDLLSMLEHSGVVQYSDISIMQTEKIYALLKRINFLFYIFLFVLFLVFIPQVLLAAHFYLLIDIYKLRYAHSIGIVPIKVVFDCFLSSVSVTILPGALLLVFFYFFPLGIKFSYSFLMFSALGSSLSIAFFYKIGLRKLQTK